MGKIAYESNRYAKQMQEANKLTAEKETTINELYVFIATCMLMTRNKKLDMKEYWSTDPLLNSPIFSNIISRNRYFYLSRILHFCNNEYQETGNRLFKIEMVLDEISANFQAGLIPFQNLVIDESLVLWKGRLSFKQFIKSKRHRFGIKLFILCDCETDYILKFIIYTGATTNLIACDSNLGTSGSVVNTLMKNYLRKGHNLFTDNWYTSPILAQFLSRNKTSLTGTVRKNRRGMPNLKTKLALGNIQSMHTKKILVLKWLDRREVFMLTTIYPDTVVDTNKTYRSGETIKKPTCVMKYNECMGSIDKTDMLLSSVECVRKTLKWYKKIFFHLIDLSLLNSHIMYKTVTGENIPLAKFQLELIRQLLEKYSTSKTNTPKRKPKNAHDRLIGRHFLSDIPRTGAGNIGRKRCTVCFANKKRTDTTYMCRECDKGLCATPCFLIYHTKQTY